MKYYIYTKIKEIKIDITKRDFLTEIKQNFDVMFNRQILNNESLKEKMKFSNINVNYEINEQKSDINVKIVRIDKNKYKIIFYYGFLDFYFLKTKNFSQKILRRNDKVYWTIFYYWMEMVFLHEFSHLVRNHFNLLTNDSNFYELGVKNSNLDNEKIKCLEIDADRFAGKFFAGIAFLSLFKFKEIMNIDNKDQIIEFFAKLAYYLYNELKTQSNLYPPTILRTIIFLSGFQEAKYQKSEIFNFIELGNLERKVIEVLNQEMSKNQENIEDLQKNINIFDEYDTCIKQLLKGV